MGNTLCVPSPGHTPHRADMILINNTDVALHLDVRQDCGQDCHHKGWILLAGKIVHGQEPPQVIPPYSIGRFSVSGREGSAKAPKGKVFYVNEEKGLEVCLTWRSSCGPRQAMPGGSLAAETVISGIEPGEAGYFTAAPKPWNQLLVGEANPATWTFTVRHMEGHVKELGMAAKNMNSLKVGLA